MADDPDGAVAGLCRREAVFRWGSQPGRDGGTQLTPEEARALGIEGDTPRDTVATLVGQVRQLRTELQTALTDNKTQKAENERLRQREGAIDRRIQSALETERNQLKNDREQVASERQQTQGLLQDLQRQFENLSNKSGHADLPVGLGLEPGDGPGADGVRWIEPEDARSDGKSRTLAQPGTSHSRPVSARHRKRWIRRGMQSSMPAAKRPASPRRSPSIPYLRTPR